MRKEVIVAILIGILLGGLVAFGVFRANVLLGDKKGKEVEVLPTPFEQEISTSQLVITQPEDSTVVGIDKVTVRGTVSKGATVVILAQSGEYIVEVKEDGSFEQTVELEGGANEMTVIAYDETGNESKQVLTIVYSTEFGGTE